MSFDDATTKQNALQQLVKVVPVVPFHGVEAFYDIGGLLANPTELQLALDLMAHEVAKVADQIDSIGCFDARGFLFAPYLGVLFKKKVFMLRKPGKMPSVSHTLEYFKEYSGDNAKGGDHLCIQEYAVKAGDRVLLVDDLLATGGTVEAGIKLVQQAGGVVKACLFAVEIGVLNGRGRAQGAAPDAKIIALLNEKDFETKQ